MIPFGWSLEYLQRMIELIGPAVVYDEETICNCFTLTAESIDKEDRHTFEISARINDTERLVMWCYALRDHRIPMIGYNNLGFDYPILHFIIQNSHILVGLPGDQAAAMIYEKAQEIIRSQDRFGTMIWEDQRVVPQIDLYKIHHFDNKAKRQSLKGLEFNMRSASVLDMPVPHELPVSAEDTDRYLIPYNGWDVGETKRFALISAEAISFRRDMLAQIKGDVLNFNETKIGKEFLIQRIGEDICYNWTPRKSPNQTIRSSIAMTDVIFPYIKFDHPEFNRVLDWMREQVLTSADLENVGDEVNTVARVSTKGVFTDVHAVVNDFRFDFGTGGIHGSVNNRAYVATDDWPIEDIDVTGLYPSIAIQNRLYPQHLGERFVDEYAKLPIERAKYAKGTTQNGAIKLGQNGAYGDSNNPYSPLYDPLYTMRTTINGQLMLCMLAEKLMQLPTFEMIQINTDGMTYRIHSSMKAQAKAIQTEWERLTQLNLEAATYRRMWIRDVNNYVAEDFKGKLKLKGDYWYPNGAAYDGGWTEAISKAGPSAWHKDLGAQIVQRAAVAAMVHGVDPYHFMMTYRDPFAYMLRAKATAGSTLYINDQPQQKTTRYFISTNGGRLHKISLPTGPIGDFKRKNKISDLEFVTVMKDIGPGVWDGRIHTANKSRYEMVDTAFQAGYLVTECNLADRFRFDQLNYGWYLEMSRKLIIT